MRSVNSALNWQALMTQPLRSMNYFQRMLWKNQTDSMFGTTFTYGILLTRYIQNPKTEKILLMISILVVNCVHLKLQSNLLNNTSLYVTNRILSRKFVSHK